MKYTISGFSQQGMCELKLSADDVNILRWFCDFRDSGKMVKEYCAEENCFYYWVKYSGLIESLPYIFYDCKTEETQKKKLQRILNGNLSKVLKKKVVKRSSGTYTFFATVDEQMQKLLGYATGTEMSSAVKHIGMEYSSATGIGDSSEHWNESFQPKDSSINNSSINNNSAKAKNETAERIWSLYPVKKGKAVAIKKIPKIIKEIGEVQLIRCIERYKSEFKNNDYTFMKHGNTFFNGAYIDYIDENYQGSKGIEKKSNSSSLNANSNYNYDINSLIEKMKSEV